MDTMRILSLNGKKPNTEGVVVVYWMSRDQRVRDNHALLAAQAAALAAGLPLLVVFNLLSSTGDRRREHYQFMLEGLREVESSLRDHSIAFILTNHDELTSFADWMPTISPSEVFCDFSPLRGPRALQKQLATTLGCRVSVVDTHNVVPVWVTSDKEEFAAHTIRRKLHRIVGDWLHEPDAVQVHPTPPLTIDGISWDRAQSIIDKVPSCGIEVAWKSGESAAQAALHKFIDERLEKYGTDRNDATRDGQSDLSPYLHYGQLSSLRIALEVMRATEEPPQLVRSWKIPSPQEPPTVQDSVDQLIEELVVRKELSDNFCYYNDSYNSLAGAREWARNSLAAHADDPREFLYTLEQFEQARTHDELWNACQHQLVRSGKIHGYMRMYWAKKILEWSESPEQAIKIAIKLNDTYSIDGGDPNGYAGILWSIAGLHDRPWFDRSVYGTIRYMAPSGAAKRFKLATYIARWS